jgi:hypothetical protein
MTHVQKLMAVGRKLESQYAMMEKMTLMKKR